MALAMNGGGRGDHKESSIATSTLPPPTKTADFSGPESPDDAAEPVLNLINPFVHSLKPGTALDYIQVSTSAASSPVARQLP